MRDLHEGNHNKTLVTMCAKKNPSYMNTCKVYYDERQIAVFTEG